MSSACAIVIIVIIVIVILIVIRVITIVVMIIVPIVIIIVVVIHRSVLSVQPPSVCRQGCSRNAFDTGVSDATVTVFQNLVLSVVVFLQ